MLIEMHCHTSEHSACSRVSAVELVQRVMAKRLQGMVLTDHHYLWKEADLEELRRQAGAPAEFVVMSGQETNVPVFGDVLIYGAPVAIPRGTPLEQIRREFPALAVVWAHPYRDGRLPADELFLSPLIDAVEIFNSNHTVRENSRGLSDWRRLGFAATGGTDTHAATYAGIYPTEFREGIVSIESLVAALRARRCLPYLKQFSHREGTKVVEVVIGKEKPDRTEEKVILRTPPSDAAWSAAERAYRIMEAIAEHGFDRGRFRVPNPLEKDPGTGVMTEQGIAGKSLYDTLLTASREEAEIQLRAAAQWLARLHLLRLRVTPPDDFLREEARRLDIDRSRFTTTSHPYRNKLAEIVDTVKTAEQEIAAAGTDNWVQGHGDYHPKNILIGSPPSSGESGPLVAAIDFERSQVMPPAFDVGWFLAQARSQFAGEPHLSGGLIEETFVEAYREAAGDLPADDFWRRVELFRARANVSIAAFFVKMQLGNSPELWRVLVESERALTYLV